MHYPSHRLSKFGQIESETVRGPWVKMLNNVKQLLGCLCFNEVWVAQTVGDSWTYFIAKIFTAMGLGHKFSQH